MTHAEIASRRLHSQHISAPVFDDPADEVAWLGAVQAQEYAAAKWGLGLRLRNVIDNDVERAFTEGTILRTHLLRPTWHFVTPADIRWILELTAPQIRAISAYYVRKAGLDGALLGRSGDVMAHALEGNNYLTRDELRDRLEAAGIATGDSIRMSYIMMHAELDRIVCSGPRRGRQFTYALLDERAPAGPSYPREVALAELARRFFASHGPATVHDLAKWSGLSVTDARSGLEDVKGEFEHAEVDGRLQWFSAAHPIAAASSPAVYLLPVYDEYTIGFRDHTAVFDAGHLGDLVFSHTLVIDGRVAGTWKRALKKNGVFIEWNSFSRLTKAQNRAVAAAIGRYGEFLGLPVASVVAE